MKEACTSIVDASAVEAAESLDPILRCSTVRAYCQLERWPSRAHLAARFRSSGTRLGLEPVMLHLSEAKVDDLGESL
jgi:hypothetical protein